MVCVILSVMGRLLVFHKFNQIGEHPMNTNKTLQDNLSLLQHEQAELEQAISDTECKHELAYIKERLIVVSGRIKELEG